SQGQVTSFDGDLQDYQRHLIEQARQRREARAHAETPSAPPAQQDPALSPAAQRRLQAQRRQQLAEKTRPLKRALEQTEQRMSQLTEERNALEQRLSTPLPPADIADAGRRLKAVTDELAALEDQWLHVSSEMEAIEPEKLS
ncbi:MAG: ABC transporter, partial [Burkholderiaceae bacterium]|nr:ABC transporter [Burkholderiaceae bacterium]